MTFEDGIEVYKVIGQAGSYSHMPDGDVHMERGGLGGATILFNLYSPDGRLTQTLDEQGNVLKTVTIRNVLKKFAN